MLGLWNLGCGIGLEAWVWGLGLRAWDFRVKAVKGFRGLWGFSSCV